MFLGTLCNTRQFQSELVNTPDLGVAALMTLLQVIREYRSVAKTTFHLQEEDGNNDKTHTMPTSTMGLVCDSICQTCTVYYSARDIGGIYRILEKSL